MEIDLMDIVEHFAYTAFKVEGVYNYSIEPGRSGSMKTSPFPGFIFLWEVRRISFLMVLLIQQVLEM